MPTYDFECDTCRRRFEQRHSIHNPPASVACEDPSCTGTAARETLNVGSAVDTRVMDGMYPYVSNRLPRNLAGCQHEPKTGKPVIASRRHEDRILKQNNCVRE